MMARKIAYWIHASAGSVLHSHALIMSDAAGT
jgi:hypothetical protein